MTAAEEWTRQLTAWAIPEEILAGAPRDPYDFPAAVISRSSVDPLTTPTGTAVRRRLGRGEGLLDVGCGAGRLSAAFTAEHPVRGVEPRPGLAATARERGLEVIDGHWPEAAGAAGQAPVVLCTHVLYDVAWPLPFLAALDRAADRRVVLEVTRRHPWVPVGPLYRLVHGIDRPEGPSAGLLADVVAEATGRTPEITEWDRPASTYDSFESLLDHQLLMLCIGPDHPVVPQVAEAVEDRVTVCDDSRVRLPDVSLSTMWWDTDG